MKSVKYLLIAALVAASPAAHAIDGVSVVYGHSDSSNASVNMGRVGVQWDWNKKLIEMGNWHVGGYWESDFGYWSNNSFAKTNSTLIDFGFTPVLRIQQTSLSAVSPYVEAGVGFHLLSRTSVSTQRQFGSAFQFGDHLGAGVRFGDKGHYDVGYRYQHLSNAGIKGPNQGINFHELRLQYHF
ncbi:MAG: acyloxyacyl hydrolase [Burkholderiales bacterium]